MNAEELARWLKDEHKTVHKLATKLQERVASIPSANHATWVGHVRDAFEHFRAHLTKVMALKEKDGYMLQVLEQRPHLSREVERLAHEHQEFTSLMNMIHQTLEKIQPNDFLLMRDCCHRVQDLLSYIEHHDYNENLIVTSAFNLDIGGWD
ncbi:MAG: hemerythrin domain-containing protein [Phycisphaerales bacterium]|nr:hemerythrin domain-containing protein [Phycisphaerales bacterium]